MAQRRRNQRSDRNQSMAGIQGGADSPFSYMIRPTFNFRRKKNRFFEEEGNKVDYKDISTLKKFITDTGKIVGQVKTALPAKVQKEVTKAIKRARYMALLPYSVKVKM